MFFIKFILISSLLAFIKSLSFIDFYGVKTEICTINWLHFRVNENCIKIIGNSVPTCIYQELFRQNIRIVTYDSWSKISPLTAANKSDCERFLQVDNDLDELKSVFNKDVKFFYTFTKIFIIRYSNEEKETKEVFNKNETKYIYKNALRVYKVEAWQRNLNYNKEIIEFKNVQNVLTGKMINLYELNQQNIYQFYDYNIQHPFLNREDSNKEFTISFHNCSPYIIYFKDGNDVKRLDGVDHRIVHEVTKNWKVRKNIRLGTANSSDPYREVVADVHDGRSDIALCSLWMTPRHMREADLSIPYEQISVRFIVPMPTLIDDVAAIYYSLSTGVWCSFIVCLICLSILLSILLRHKFNANHHKVSLGYCIFYLVDIATGHGSNYPSQKSVIRYILLSWMLVSLAIGTGYASGYFSMLTNPKYSTPVDTIEQFLEEGFQFAELWLHKNFLENLQASDNPNHIELSKRRYVFQNKQDVLEKMSTGKYGLYSKRSSSGYLYDCEAAKNFAASYRVMKSYILNFFVVHAFQKDSPYRELFNHYLFSFIETGIIKYWFADVVRKNSQDFIRLFTHPDRLTDIKRPLTLKKLSGAFYLLVVGLTASFCSLLGELIAKRRKRRIAVV